MCLQRKHASKRDYNTTSHVHVVPKSAGDILCVDFRAQCHLHVHTVSKFSISCISFLPKFILSDQTITTQIAFGASCVLCVPLLCTMCYQKSMPLLEQKFNHLSSLLPSTAELACLWLELPLCRSQIPEMSCAMTYLLLLSRVTTCHF